MTNNTSDPIDNPQPLKTCTKCGKQYPRTFDYFYRSSKNKDGFRSRCKVCTNKDNVRWNKENPEKRAAYHKTYQQANREKVNKWHREWVKNNPDAIRAMDKKKYEKQMRENPERVRELQRKRGRKYIAKNSETHRDRSRESMRRWRASNRETHRLRESNRRARIKSLPCDLSEKDWLRALDYFNHSCAYCGSTPSFWVTLAMDHYIPLASENCPGTTASNIVPACHSKTDVPDGNPGCNQSKSNKDPETWLNERFGKREARTIHNRIQSYFESVRRYEDSA